MKFRKTAAIAAFSALASLTAADGTPLAGVETPAAPSLARITERVKPAPRPAENVSPDGKWIAYTVRTGGEFTFEQVMVAVVPAAGGTPKVLTADLDRSASGLRCTDSVPSR